MKCRNCKNNSLREEDGEQFTWCDVVVDNLDIDKERECTAFRPATKADQIRAMTDEELADFMGTLPCCPPGTDLDELCYPLDSCEGTNHQIKCWLDWLKQEATFNAETETTNCKDGGDTD